MLTALALSTTIATAGPITIRQQGAKTVAILPWVYRGGTQGAVDTARETVHHFFRQAGYDVLESDGHQSFWHGIDFQGPETEYLPNMPTDHQLRQIGKDLGVDMVSVGEVYWHTRSIWVSLGPKTKSTCHVDLKMADMDNNGAILTEHDVTADDTAEESGFQTAAGILTGGLVTVVSGGPETPHQQRAVQIALSEAFEPWLEGAIGR